MKMDLSASRMLQAGPVSPVVMATCVDSEGKANIITLGMFMSISQNPPMVCIGVSPKRYSHGLIAEQGEFTVNVPSIHLKEEVHLCGTRSGRDANKFKETGLIPLPSKKVKPPRIEECYGHLECRVVQTYTCGDHTLFVGDVVAASADEEVIKDGRLSLAKAKPIIQKNWEYHTVGIP